MKKTILSLALTALFFAGCDTAPMNNSGEGKSLGNQGSNPLFDPDYYYEIDTWGSNADVYEFTPKSNPNYVCIIVGTGQGRTSQCIPKLTKKEIN